MALNYDLNNTGPQVQELLDEVVELRGIVGEGGSVDQRISNAVDAEESRATEAENAISEQVAELKHAVGTGGSVDTRIANAVDVEKTRAEAKETQLMEIYQALDQSAMVVLGENDELPNPGVARTIYRKFGGSSYTDYMYDSSDLTTAIPLATYDNAVDEEPTPNSDNLVKSGGVARLLSTGTPNYVEVPYAILASGIFSNSTASKHAAIKVKEGEKYLIRNLQSSSASSPYTRYAFATNGHAESNGNIPLVPNTSVVVIAIGDERFVTIPSGCEYLLVNYGESYPLSVNGYMIVDDEPIAESGNLVKSGGVDKMLSLIHLHGADYTRVDSSLRDVKGGNNYRLYINTPDIDFSYVSGTSSYTLIFGIYAYDKNKALIDGWRTGYKGSDTKDIPLDDYYDFTVPQQARYIMVSLRASYGELFSARLVDMTPVTEIEVPHVDETGAKNPSVNAAANADDLMQLRALCGDIGVEERKYELVEEGTGRNVFSSAYIQTYTNVDAEKYALPKVSQSSASDTKYVVVDVEGCSKVRFLGALAVTSVETGIAFAGYAFYSSDNYDSEHESFLDDKTGLISFRSYDGKTSDVATKEYIVNVPANAKYMKISCLTEANTLDKFYCYLQTGKSIKDRLYEEEDYREVELSNAMQYEFVIGTSSRYRGVWVSAGSSHLLIPVSMGDELRIYRRSSGYVHYAFLENNNAQQGGSASFVAGTYVVLVKAKESVDDSDFETVIVPKGAEYLYLKNEEKDRLYLPPKVMVKSGVFDEDDEQYRGILNDTMIEEDLTNVTKVPITGRSDAYFRDKVYKIDTNFLEDYRLILFLNKLYPETPVVSILDSSGTVIGSYMYPDSEESKSYKMIKLIGDTEEVAGGEAVLNHDDWNENAYSIKLHTFVLETETNRSYMCALMKPLVYGVIPKNQFSDYSQFSYCVTKISKAQFPIDYSEQVAFQQGEEWAAWGFMLPYGFNRDGHRYPIASIFHGTSGIVTSETFSYKLRTEIPVTDDNISVLMREQGFIVFDINGYGISQMINAGDTPNPRLHWGCPRAVELVKKAYDILRTVFHGQEKMAILGQSMGGAISKSYVWTYPDDVRCVALNAPSELGFTIRGELSESVLAKNVAWSWGYPDVQSINNDNKERFIGYGGLFTPRLIDADGNLKATTVNGITVAELRDVDNIHFLDNYSLPPMKIWHGDADTNVDVIYTKRLVDTLRRGGNKCTFRLCPGQPHNLYSVPWVLEETIAFCKSFFTF